MEVLLISIAFEVLSYAIGSLFWSLLFTVLVLGLLFFLVKTFYTKQVYTPLSFIAGGVLFGLLFFQAVCICGAFKLKSLTDDIVLSINQYIPEESKSSEHKFTTDEIHALAENLKTDYPLFGNIIGEVDFRGHNTMGIGEAMTGEFCKFLNGYIWRRVGWSLSFITLGGFIMIKTMDTYCPAGRKRGSATRKSMRHNDF